MKFPAFCANRMLITLSLYIHRASFIIDLFVPTDALRQFFHCSLYYYDAPIRISAVILPLSGSILRRNTP
jgi:hypothetical protein